MSEAKKEARPPLDLAISKNEKAAGDAQPGIAIQQETQPVPQPRSGLEFQLNPQVPGWLLLVLPILFLVVVQRAYSRTTREVSILQRLFLGLLRLGALALLLVCLARPVAVRHGQLEEKGLCFVALDNSASMSFRDLAGARSRWDGATSILAAHAAHLAKIESGAELQRYVFSAAPRRVTRLPSEAGAPASVPDGGSTDLAAMLEALATEAAGVPTAGALLISDGRHNQARDVISPAMALHRAGVPLYVLGLGQDATPADYRDIRIKQLVVPEKAFIGSEMALGIEMESTLATPQSTLLTVEVDGKKIYQKKTDFPAGAGVPHPLLDVPYTPDTLGVHRVTATLLALPQEANVANNVATAFFRVFRNKIGVWYVEGALRKEFGAIRTALETAPNLSLKALNAFAASTSAPSELLPGTPQEWSQTRLVIIGDLAAEQFESSGLTALADFVEKGGAVLLLGGQSTLGPGKWQGSPLSAALPVEMTALDRLQDGPLKIAVASAEAAHPVLKLAETPEKSAQIWDRLPALPGVNTVSGVRPVAHVLLKAGPHELLIVQDYGKGRSGVFAADMTWQWILKGGQGEAHKAFWRNLVTWLTHSDYRDSNKAVFADSDRLHYLVGDEAVFGAHVYEAEKLAKSVENARIAIALTRLDGPREIPVLKEDVGRGKGDYTRRFALGAAGNYRFTAAAYAPDNSLIDSDSLDLHVTAPDVENDNPKANLRLLRRIAALSGGLYFDPDKATQAFDCLLSRPAGYTKSLTDVSELWSNAWMLSAFVLLLSLEWAARKRWGLV